VRNGGRIGLKVLNHWVASLSAGTENIRIVEHLCATPPRFILFLQFRCMELYEKCSYDC